jgi:hypothetical protein
MGKTHTGIRHTEDRDGIAAFQRPALRRIYVMIARRVRQIPLISPRRIIRGIVIHGVNADGFRALHQLGGRIVGEHSLHFVPADILGKPESPEGGQFKLLSDFVIFGFVKKPLDGNDLPLLIEVRQFLIPCLSNTAERCGIEAAGIFPNLHDEAIHRVIC